MSTNKNNNLTKEKRTVMCEVRVADDDADNPVIEGVPIVIDKATDIGGMFEETIARGALDKTDLRDVPFLVNHDFDSIPIARSRRNNGNSTMTLEVKNDGLHIKAKPDVKNNARAAELYSAIKRGDINGMSFCFTVSGEEWKDEQSDYPSRTITAIDKVYEVSAVTFPAYEQTSINARSVELESAKALLEARRSVGKQKKDDVSARLRMQIEIESMA